jgi:hypothetical protein
MMMMMIIGMILHEFMRGGGVEGVVRGLGGIHLADRSILTKLE